MRVNAAPECALGGDLYRVGRDPQSADPEAIKMGLPGGLVGEMSVWLTRQLADDRPSQRPTTHIACGGVVDHIIGVPGTQHVKKV